ncbi:MAG: acyl-CoA thioesterase [Candidatus Binataceae bacterium]
MEPPCNHISLTRLVVRPADMDADRNVSNVAYFEYFFQSRLEHLSRLGVLRPGVFTGGNLFALAENSCRYMAPSYYGDVLLLWTATHAVGRSSFQLVYRAWRERDGLLIATAHSVQVWLDHDNKSTPLPASVRDALTASVCPDLPKTASHN